MLNRSLIAYFIHMKIQRTFLLVVIIGIYQMVYAQHIPGYTSRVESDADFVSIQINALPQKATRYHYTEIDRQTTGERSFVDTHIDDEFTLTPVSFSEDLIGLKFHQGTAMWKRIFLLENAFPEKWDQLTWPELLLSVEAQTGKMTLMNGSEIRPFLEARFAELDNKLNSVDSLKSLTVILAKLKPMLNDDESLRFWLTQPIQLMGHGQLIEGPKLNEVDLTQTLINSEISDTIQRTYKVIRNVEDGNNIRYTREGQNALSFFGYKKATNNLIPTPTITTQEEWLLNGEGELIEVSRESMTISNSKINSLDIEKSVHIVRLEEE